MILYGSGRQTIPFTYVNERGRTVIREHTFEGVVTNLQRRYRETDSMAVKEELAKFINEKECPSCHGARLRVEARFVKVGSGKQQRAIYEVAATVPALDRAAGQRQVGEGDESRCRRRASCAFAFKAACEVAFCSIEIAGDKPSIMSTSGFSINCKNWRA